MSDITDFSNNIYSSSNVSTPQNSSDHISSNSKTDNATNSSKSHFKSDNLTSSILNITDSFSDEELKLNLFQKSNSSKSGNSSKSKANSTYNNYSNYSWSTENKSINKRNNSYELEKLVYNLKKRLKKNDSLIQLIKYPELLISSLEDLNGLVGMHRLKKSVALQVMRLIEGLKNGEKSDKMLNTVLYGPPGVGKTKVGLLLAKIWFALGYLTKNKPTQSITKTIKNINSSDDNSLSFIIPLILAYGATYAIQIISFMYRNIGLFWLSIILGIIILIALIFYYSENTYNWVTNYVNETYYNETVDIESADDRDLISVVSRNNFVAGYLGQTAAKTEKLLNDNIGKVLFIDEAYSLLNDARDAYGMEALTTLNLFLSENPGKIVVIFAGYEDLMKYGIFAAQPGLLRRCMWKFKIDGYNGDELSDIFFIQAKKEGWKIHSSEIKKIRNLINTNKKLFVAYGGDTERLLFFSQLEASKNSMSNSSEILEGKNLTYNDIKMGIISLKENN